MLVELCSFCPGFITWYKSENLWLEISKLLLLKKVIAALLSPPHRWFSILSYIFHLVIIFLIAFCYLLCKEEFYVFDNPYLLLLLDFLLCPWSVSITVKDSEASWHDNDFFFIPFYSYFYFHFHFTLLSYPFWDSLSTFNETIYCILACVAKPVLSLLAF